MKVGRVLTVCLSRLGRIASLVLAFGLAAAPAQLRASEALVFHGSVSGKQTLDDGEGGGNPFASALIEALATPSLALSELPSKLQQLTAKKSKGFQTADVPSSVGGEYPLVPARTGERRIAMVMVVSDYAVSGAQSLPGAKHDAERVAQALRRAGFQTELALDLDLRGMRRSLEEFNTRSRDADAAVVYTTGHGVEVDRTVYLLPGDYPIAERNAALSRRALPLPEISRAPAARRVNLVFYGGCRDNPFAQ